ncbi:MAG: anti-sigma factor family protein [Candidatus Scalinduaceae bacterium]
MNCKEARRYINLFLDSELDSKTNLEITEHLSSCEDCSKRFAQEERIEKSFVSVLKEDKDPKAEEIWERTISSFGHQVESRGERRLGSWFYIRYVVTATVAILAIIITLIMYSKQESNDLTAAVHKCHMEYITNKTIPSIESVSPGEVAKYFSGKFTFPVVLSEIPDIKSHHIRLFGGKVCHINGISAAYVMYHCCNTPVSVFILSTKDAEIFYDTKQYLKGDKVLFKKIDGIKLIVTPANQDTFVCVVADHDIELLRWVANNFIRT